MKYRLNFIKNFKSTIMNFTEDQQNYFDYLKNTVIPELQNKNLDSIKMPLINLEWNCKKILKEDDSEIIDINTYVHRTKADFTMIKEALDEGDELAKFADDVLGKIDTFFNVEKQEAEEEGTVTHIEPIDIDEFLANKASGVSEKLDYKKSIVDLCKLLGLESSYSSRKKYALSLGFPQEQMDKVGSAEVNIWLHKQLLSHMANNAGNLPDTFIA